MAYHEINGSRRYEYRYSEDDWTGWIDAGPATTETLAKIKAGLPDTVYEIREVCAVADDAAQFVGSLIFSELVEKQELDIP